MKTRRNLYIDDKLWVRLKGLASDYGVSVSELIRRSIIEFLRREEG